MTIAIFLLAGIGITSFPQATRQIQDSYRNAFTDKSVFVPKRAFRISTVNVSAIATRPIFLQNSFSVGSDSDQFGADLECPFPPAPNALYSSRSAPITGGRRVESERFKRDHRRYDLSGLASAVINCQTLKIGRDTIGWLLKLRIRRTGFAR